MPPVTSRPRALAAALLVAWLGNGCSAERQPTGMDLTSPAFANEGDIPERFSCLGENVPPPLRWSPVPPRSAAELALVIEDRDAPRGRFVNWLVVGIDPATTRLEPDALPPGARVLEGSSGNDTYVGPCPPDGSGVHRYVFQVYALSHRPELPADATPLENVRAVRRAARAGGILVGTFER